MTNRIIDMRLRPPIPAWTSGPTFKTAMYFPRKIPNMPGAPSAWNESMDELFDEMDRAGVRWGVVIGRASMGAGELGGVGNDAIIGALDQWPDRFVGFLGVDLEHIDESLAQIRDLAGHGGVRGVSIEPGSGKVPRHSDDESLTPVYETCIDLDLPVSISLSGLLSALAGHDISWSSPIPVQRAAMRYPELTFIVSHAAYPWAVEMVTIAMFCENIYVSPDLYMVGINLPGADEYVKAANMYMGDRTLFGTAYPSRPLVESVKAFDEWTFAPGVKEKVLGRNALRVMRMA